MTYANKLEPVSAETDTPGGRRFREQYAALREKGVMHTTIASALGYSSDMGLRHTVVYGRRIPRTRLLKMTHFYNHVMKGSDVERGPQKRMDTVSTLRESGYTTTTSTENGKSPKGVATSSGYTLPENLKEQVKMARWVHQQLGDILKEIEG